MHKSKGVRHVHGITREFILSVYALFYASICASAPGSSLGSQGSQTLWAHDQLIPWVVGVYDVKPLTSEQRAAMLERLGFKKFAYFWEPDRRSSHDIDEEIDALQRHGIEPVAWWFSYFATDPFARELLDSFKRHHIAPQLWISPRYRDIMAVLKTSLPARLAGVRFPSDLQTLSVEDRAAFVAIVEKAWDDSLKNTFEPTAGAQAHRVQWEADQIRALVRLAAPYGSRISLYNHGGWSGIVENEIAVIANLRTTGITDVGLVYAFNHVRDAQHDDTKAFPTIWNKIKPYVTAVTLTGICMDDGSTAYPSQGDSELSMMRTIQESGWRGQVGLFAGEWHGRGDAEKTLQNILIGVDWLAATLRAPEFAGPRPFPRIPLSKQP